MERLTDKNAVGNYFYPKCFEKCDGLGASSKCDNCDIMTSICEKLGKYEDLEERLNKVYGDCDGLLLRVVSMLEKHPGIDMANNTLKSRLITDEEVDKREEYKQLEKQGILVKLPCRVGDTVYGISMGKIITLIVNEISIFYMKGEKIINVKCQNKDKFRNYVEREFGKTVFLTQSEAEEKLKELRGEENDNS